MIKLFEPRKAKAFREICNSILNEADRKFSMFPSAKDDILPIINSSIEHTPKNDWNNMTYSDIEKSAYSIIFNAASDIACSGKYHIGLGVINPLSPIKSFEYLVYKSIDYAVAHGELTEAQGQEQKNIFNYNINHAG